MDEPLPSLEAVTGMLRMLEAANLRYRGTPVSQLDADERILVYRDALVGLSDEEILSAARAWMRREEFFPTPSCLRSMVRPRAAEGEAADAYQRAMGCNTYAPQGGAVWSYRQIAAEIGREAADAFLAAGGHEAFAVTNPVGDQFRFKRFVEAYVAAVNERNARGLIAVASIAATKPEQIGGGD